MGGRAAGVGRRFAQGDTDARAQPGIRVVEGAKALLCDHRARDRTLPVRCAFDIPNPNPDPNPDPITLTLSLTLTLTLTLTLKPSL